MKYFFFVDTIFYKVFESCTGDAYAFVGLHFCAFSRPDTLDPALLRPGRLDRKVEFGLPDLESRTQIFKIHTRTMNCERDIRFELLARLCPNSTGKSLLVKFLVYCFRHGSTLSCLDICDFFICRGRHKKCVHRGWNVCYSGSKKNSDRERFPGCGEQGHQGISKV